MLYFRIGPYVGNFHYYVHGHTISHLVAISIIEPYNVEHCNRQVKSVKCKKKKKKLLTLVTQTVTETTGGHATLPKYDTYLQF